MKVHEGHGSIIQQANTTQKNRSSEGSDFQKIMDNLSSTAEGSKVAQGQEMIPPVDNGIQILYGVEKVGASSDLSGKEQIVNELQSTLDLIDFYSKKLGDSSMPVSDLDSLIGHLEGSMENLKDLGSSANTPEKVKPIISDMVITIGAEIAKFRRGDYV